LERRLGIAAEKIDVVPLAAELPADRSATPEAELRERLHLGGRSVVISPGTKRPHKNAEGAIAALARIEQELRPVLVITGYRTEYEENIRACATALGVADHLRMPEWLSRNDMEGLYAIASAVVFPSRYEGFGLPVLEAMIRGVPVITSNRSSLPEVAGGAALLVDPDDPAAIAHALRELTGDSALRARLVRAGHARAEQFSWAQTADLTVASYRRALGS
jgi:glycosyltransferase involved in cell wall biosynthesis